MARSTCGVPAGVIVSVSVAVLLLRLVSTVPAGGATVAVLVIEPDAEALIVAERVNVITPPGKRLPVVWILPVPLIAATLEPEVALAVQVALLMPDGRTSSTDAPVTVVEVLLVTVMI